MKRNRAAVLLIASALTLSTNASAQQPSTGAAPTKEALDEARTRYERGTQLYGEGDYKLALIEFTRAYDLAPNYKVLFNIGQVNLQLGNYAAARRAFEQYVKDGAGEIPDKRKAEIEKELASLRNRTAHINVVTNVDGAEITVDGIPVGVTPLKDRLLVDAGQHTVAAKKVGRIAASRAVTLAGTDDIKIEFELPEEVTPVTPAGVGPPIGDKETPVERDEPSYIWVPWVITGALAAGATVTGIFALSAADDLNTERDEPTTQAEMAQKRGTLEDAESKARTLAIATDVLAGSAVVAGAIAIIYTVSELNSGEQSSAGPRRPSPSVALGVGPGSVALRGKF
jgi:hypothetical protein